MLESCLDLLSGGREGKSLRGQAPIEQDEGAHGGCASEELNLIDLIREDTCVIYVYV